MSTASKPARFYLLPKIHKRGVPGRPVVSSCGSITENVSKLVDWFLKPLITTIPSYVRDTRDFLAKLRSVGVLPKDSLLVTLDVVSLYPSIPHSDGLLALNDFLSAIHIFHNIVMGIIDLTRLVLTKNFFEFNDQLYLQTSGTAIGTVMAVCYAIIFMHVFETGALDSAILKPFVWFRYIDDIFSIWTHGEKALLEFVDHLNAINPSIKFTVKFSPTHVNFLDVDVSVNADGVISTDLFVKPTDTHQFLHSSSCHPGHVRASIPYSQALRIISICSNSDIAKLRCQQLEEQLVRRGYNRKKVHHQILKAFQRTDSDSYSRTQVSETPLILTFHPGLPDVKAILRHLHPVLTASPTMRQMFPLPPMVSFRRPDNISNHLVRAKVNQANTHVSHSCGPCESPRCQLCSIIPYNTTIVSKTTGKVLRLFCGVGASCKSTNVVYCLVCDVCGMQYVGVAKSLRSRLNNHMSCIRLGRIPLECRTLYEHFNSNHSTHFHCVILDTQHSRDDLLRAESRWILKLRTLSPFGLNSQDGV